MDVLCIISIVPMVKLLCRLSLQNDPGSEAKHGADVATRGQVSFL